MAVDVETLANPRNSAIQVYRAAFATPVSLEAMRFWLQGELDRIQADSLSTDEAIKALASAIVGGGAEGPQGPAGVPGEAGADGVGVTVYQQTSEPSGARPGDIWFVMGYE